MFQTDFLLRNVRVTGEVSNCKYHSSGHIYFTLKDEAGALACVMYAGDRMGMKFTLDDGMKIIASGRISVYERDGKYQLYVKSVQRDGAGALYERYLALKMELEEMGMFDASYKKPLPKYALNIGVVTAQTGAVIHDIQNVAYRRNPYIQIYLYPAKVQGEGASETICEGIRTLDAMNPDVIIIGRGGGSIEDLWAFNEEIVARAIANSRIPVISCVGHEIDFTIADFVADVRAATPSAAAELAVPERQQIQNQLNEFAFRLSGALERGQFARRERLENLTGRSAMLNPEKLILEPRRAIVNADAERAERAISRVLERAKHQLGISESALRTLNPAGVLERGYAIVSRGERVLTHASQIHTGDALAIRFADGTAYATGKNGENAHGEEKNHV